MGLFLQMGEWWMRKCGSVADRESINAAHWMECLHWCNELEKIIKNKKEMKSRYIVFFALLFGTILNGQSINTLNGYKYVVVDVLQYQNGGTDIWGISARLMNLFEAKGFKVIRSVENLPQELVNNPCLVIRCFIDHSNVISGTNEVRITLKNCQDKVVYTNSGGAMGWSLQDDYNKATKKAFLEIENFDYKYNSLLTPEIQYPRVESVNESESSLKNYLDTNKIDPIEGIYQSYSGDNTEYYKLGIKKNRDKYIAFIIESGNKVWKPKEVKIYLEPSAYANVFSVKYLMGDKESVNTFGTLENGGTLLIELNSGEQKVTSKFIKLYPKNITDNVGASPKVTNNVDFISSGTGFAISSNGYVVTNYHVIKEANSIQVQVNSVTIGKKNFNAKVTYYDEINDLAILKIDDDSFVSFGKIPFAVKTQTSDVGTKVFTMGYPATKVFGEDIKVTDGIISSKTGIKGNINHYQISAPITFGNSGGPLFDSQGDLIGVTHSGFRGEGAENVNYAIKANYLQTLIELLEEKITLPFEGSISKLPLTEQVKQLQNFVFIIKVK